MFDLIGVVERWDELCALLNQLLPVPVGSCPYPSARIDGTHGSAAWKAQEVAAMGEARAELVVRRHVEADITARCCLSLSGSCAWECGSPSPRCCSADVALGRRRSSPICLVIVWYR